jgi:hypothetical protein
MVFGLSLSNRRFSRRRFLFWGFLMRTKAGQSIIEYVLLVALAVFALILGANFGAGAFNKHFKAASDGYFIGGGTKP